MKIKEIIRKDKMNIPIAALGPLQKIDIENSSGIVFYDDDARICTVIKQPESKDERGDKSPFRMANLFGGNWQDYNNHFIVQVSGCPLSCPYCYVDNLKPDRFYTSKELVNKFIHFKKQFNNINVFHLMGGAPGVFCSVWPDLRSELDLSGSTDVILFSDVIFVEEFFFNKKPWDFLNIKNFLLTGCLKGTNRKNFFDNTKHDLFENALNELKHYIDYSNFYLSLINYDENDLVNIYKIIDKDRIDFLKIINYEVTKQRMTEIS
jgi:uncharacterized Fe-S cluster-containing radical SAM superfamily protein